MHKFVTQCWTATLVIGVAMFTLLTQGCSKTETVETGASPAPATGEKAGAQSPAPDGAPKPHEGR